MVHGKTQSSLPSYRDKLEFSDNLHVASLSLYMYFLESEQKEH